MLQNVVSVAEKVKETGFVIHDDHMGGRPNYEIQGVGMLSVYTTEGNIIRRYPVALHKGKYCLNSLYICKEDGKVHLSTFSVGGVVNGMSTEDIMEHNKEMLDQGWGFQVLEIVATK